MHNMSSSKKHKPWSDRVHESVVSRNKSGQLNLVIKGGAEEGKFPYFGPVKQEKVIYHSGKIQDGEILLEVNDQSIVGLTLFDLNNLIKQTPDPVRFKSVKEGPPLVKDLKVYLNHRFDKESVDNQLQAAIRDNLYLRSLPCTTRKLRNGETDGVDYQFLTVEEFKELEKSGALLESGIFEGNYYGTPKPPSAPLSPHAVKRGVTASGDHQPGNLPNEKTKSKVNSTQVESSADSQKMESESSSDAGEKPALDSLDTSQHVNGVSSQSPPSTRKDMTVEESFIHSEKVLGPLPEGWEMAKTENGDFYFIDHLGKKTSWVDPRLENRTRKRLEECDDDELPQGWEKIEDEQFGTYYVDHIEKKTQYANPVLEAKKKLIEADEKPLSADHLPEERVPIDDKGNKVVDEQDGSPDVPVKLKGIIHSVPIEKSAKGFGFTIVGGDDPEEFLQIKSVVPGGSAALTGNIEQGDVIVKVNDTQVLGWTHPDVVKLFQSIPVGQIVTLELRRGYPLLVDSDDPDTNIVTTYAIRPEDKPTEEFQRQLRQLNSQLEQHNRDYLYSGMEAMNVSSPSKSMPDISLDQNYEDQGYYGNSDLPPPPTFPYQNMYSRSGSMGALPTPVVLQVIIEKGEDGFGFTIADSPKGQKVEQILDGNRCRSLQEGDVLLEINGETVQNMPHNNVVQLLKDCPYNSAVIFIIQRGAVLGSESGALMANRANAINQSTSTLTDGYPHQAPGNWVRMKRSQTEPGLCSENGSVVSAPPGSALPNHNYPATAMLNEYRQHNANVDRGAFFNQPMPHPSMYPSYGGSQSFQTDPYVQDSFIDLTVTLRREESGFGFRILGGNAQDEAVSIGAIVPNGSADKEGTLRTGDELLTVDGKRVTRMGHNQVVSLMGHAARNAVVRLGIRRRVGGAQVPSRPFRAPAQRQLAPSGVRPSSRGPGGAIAKQAFDLVIHRREHEGFGFVIISSVKPSGVGLQAPHKIGRIIKDSPANRCNRLRVGDRVLAINNVDITRLHHGQIVNLIKNSGLSITLHVLPLAVYGDDDDMESGFQSDGNFKVVELQRWPKGFGFGIRGGREYNMPLYVLRVAEDGPAAASGRVQVGDILIEINGLNATDIAHAQAINLIKQGGPTVRLMLKSGDGHVPDIETNSPGSVHSMSSSAVSGSDPNAMRSFVPEHYPNRQEQSLTTHNASSPMRAPLGGAGHNAFKQTRRRANSSGQIVLAEEPSSPLSIRMRRAITPNPSLAYREAGAYSSESDGGPDNVPLSGRQRVPTMAPFGGQTSQYDSSALRSDGGRREFPMNPIFTSAPTPSHPAKSETELASSRSTVDDDIKKGKSKKNKFGKSKLSKVGLWVSPKKK